MYSSLVQRGLPRLLLATVLAAGALMAWAMVVSMASGTWRSLAGGVSSYESLVIFKTGEALVQTSYVRGAPGFRELEYRTLDGRPTEPPSAAGGRIASGAAFDFPLDDPIRLDSQRIWQQRIVGFVDDGAPPNYWYLVDEIDQPGHSYFEGYGSVSRRPIGYLGTRGFSIVPPPASEQFPFDRRMWHGRFANPYPSYGARPQGRLLHANLLTSRVFLVSAGELKLVDLAEQSVATLPLPGEAIEAISVALASDYTRSGTGQRQADVDAVTDNVAPDNIAPAIDALDIDAADGDAADDRAAPDTEVEDEQFQVIPALNRLAVRGPGQIHVLRPNGTLLRTIDLPEPLRERPLSMYLCADGQVVLVDLDLNFFGSRMQRLFWLDENGAQVREAEVMVRAGMGPPNPRAEAALSAIAMPSPVLNLVGYLWLEPRNRLRQQRAADYPAALASVVAEVWPATLVLLIVSGVAAAWCYQRHRRYETTGAGGWALYVFLLGLPGLAGYLWHRTWPHRAACPTCGVPAPRDRGACFSCSEEFPRPMLKGIELFA